MGLAAYYDSVGKLNPSLNSQLSPISATLSKLQSDKVIPITTDGGTKYVTLNEFVKLREGDSSFAKRHPWTGAAAIQAGAVANQTRLMQQLLDSQKVQVRTPDGPVVPEGGGGVDIPPSLSIEDIGTMTLEGAKTEIPKRIIHFQSEIARRKKEMAGLRKTGATKSAAGGGTTVSGSVWGGPVYKSGVVKADTKYILIREKTLEQEIAGLEQEINKLNKLSKDLN
tara:strand:- start:34 stop:708 length:675 start_codon:yes stop_codon:yes gene_type:complete